MMENTELIKALRKCGKASADRCWGCDYYDREPWCESALANDAADAIEAADKRIEELEKSSSWKAYAALEESIEGYKTRIAELEAKIPKEAHWVAVENGHGVCSNCNRQDSIDNMATHCRYCGAVMD